MRERGCASFFEGAPIATTPCSCSTYPSLISPMVGAARLQNINTCARTPDEPMQTNGARLHLIDAAQGSIVIAAPVAAVYERWLAFEDYPKFITAIKRVRKLDENHFIASLGFNGKQYEATLEFMLCVPERRLAWRTLADHRAPDHFAAGVVSFTSLSNQNTCVMLKLTSSFGGAVSSRVDRYLHNFKRLIEQS